MAALLPALLVVSEGIRPEVLVTFRDWNSSEPALNPAVLPVPQFEPASPVQIAQAPAAGRMDAPHASQQPISTPAPLRTSDGPHLHIPLEPASPAVNLPPDPEHLTPPAQSVLRSTALPQLDTRLHDRLDRLQDQLTAIAQQQLAGERQTLLLQQQTQLLLQQAQPPAVSAAKPQPEPPWERLTRVLEALEEVGRLAPPQTPAAPPNLPPSGTVTPEPASAPVAIPREQPAPPDMTQFAPPRPSKTTAPALFNPEEVIDAAGVPATEAAPVQDFPSTLVTAPASPPAEAPDALVLAAEQPANGRFVVRAHDVDVRHFLGRLAEVTQQNLILSPQVAGTITLEARSLTAEQILHSVTKTLDLAVAHEDTLLIVRPRAEAVQLARANQRPVTRVYRPQTVAAADLLETVKPLLSPAPLGNVSLVRSVSSSTQESVPATDTGSLVLQDAPDVLERVLQIMTELDVAPRQVVLEALLLEIPLDADQPQGVIPGLISGASAAAWAGDVQAGDLAHLLDQLPRRNAVRVLAAPRLRVLDRQLAEVQLGVTGWQAAPTSEPHSGVTLRVRPTLIEGGRLRLEILPQRVAQLLSTEGQPQSSRATSLSTSVLIPNGGTALFSGLITEQQIPQPGIVIPSPLAENTPRKRKYWWSSTTAPTVQTLAVPPLVVRTETLVLVTATLLPLTTEGEQVARQVPSQSRQPVAQVTARRAAPIQQVAAEVPAEPRTPFERRTTARRYYEQARTDFDRRQYSAARAALTLSLRYNPDDLLAQRLHHELQRLSQPSRTSPVVPAGGSHP